MSQIKFSPIDQPLAIINLCFFGQLGYGFLEYGIHIAQRTLFRIFIKYTEPGFEHYAELLVLALYHVPSGFENQGKEIRLYLSKITPTYSFHLKNMPPVFYGQCKNKKDHRILVLAVISILASTIQSSILCRASSALL